MHGKSQAGEITTFLATASTSWSIGSRTGSGKSVSGAQHTGVEEWGEKQFSTLKQAKLRSFVAHEYARDRLGWGS